MDMAHRRDGLDSICVFCGSSEAADPDFLAAAKALGLALAKADLRLVYGGGGVGLMGACARGAHEAGGRVLGIIPDFLVGRERALESVEHAVVTSMHQRKQMMFEHADGFVILPGGIGTLEEVVELLSWRRLELHTKPVVFYNPRDFWRPLFELFQMTVDEHLTPPGFMDCWRSVARVEEIIPALLAMAQPGPDASPAVARIT
ncbi:MAG: hypothetical protein JWP86_1952 [Phenylobacterium sp.]|nr:hypothetical protein [Phenylobacterium sp.]MDB5494615.1 hypothetical protein [Phenylobacterium sp.]